MVLLRTVATVVALTAVATAHPTYEYDSIYARNAEPGDINPRICKGTYEACFGYKKNKRPSTSSDLGSFARPQIQAGSITRREPKKNKGICKGTNKACGLGDDPKPKLLQRSFDNETLDPRDAEAEPEAFEEYDDLFIREVEPEAEDPDIFARDADAEAIEDYDDLFARDAEAEAAEAFDDVFARDAEAEAFPDDED